MSIKRSAAPTTPTVTADLHVHATLAVTCIRRAVADLEGLRASGLERLLLYVSAEPFDADAYRTNLLRVEVPGLPQHVMDAPLQPEPITVEAVLDAAQRLPEIGIVPLVRSANKRSLDAAEAALDCGAPALKVVHAPDRVDDQRDALRAAHERAIAHAECRSVPVILHVDLRTDGDWTRSCLRSAPGVRFCIAHLGYSRRCMDELFDDHPVVADIANLAEQLDGDRDGYRSFLERHAGRVVFGSDAFLGGLGRVHEHVRAVRSLDLAGAAGDALFRDSWQIFFGDRASVLDPAPVLAAMAAAHHLRAPS